MFVICVCVTIQKLGEDTDKVHIHSIQTWLILLWKKETLICKAYDKNKKNRICLLRTVEKCTCLKTKKKKVNDEGLA